MKKLRKIMLMLTIASCLFAIASPNVSFAGKVSSEIEDVEVTPAEAGDLTTTIGKVLGFLQVAAGLTAVVVIALTGFNYITAETAGMKDELKRKMLPIVIGIVLVFGATSVSRFIVGSIETSKTQTNNRWWRNILSENILNFKIY